MVKTYNQGNLIIPLIMVKTNNQANPLILLIKVKTTPPSSPSPGSIVSTIVLHFLWRYRL